MYVGLTLPLAASILADKTWLAWRIMHGQEQTSAFQPRSPHMSPACMVATNNGPLARILSSSQPITETRPLP